MDKLFIEKKNSIGVFDSGVGGIGVLKELMNVLPNENFIFYGDSKNAPYGEKSPAEITDLVNNAVEQLLALNVKAVVIACNTATSVAINTLRSRYPQLPIIGMEPALKPAVSEPKRNRVLVMATSVTLHLDKYLHLQHRFEDKAEIIPLECPGLAGEIEKGDLKSSELKALLERLLGPYKGKIDNVVLGCTHYPFVKKLIKEILGDIPVLDGGKGTAQQLKRVLSERDLLNPSGEEGKITFMSSKELGDVIDTFTRLYELYELD